MVCILASPEWTYDPIITLSNYASWNVNDELARIEGVGAVRLFGGRRYSYAVNFGLIQIKVAGLGLSPSQITAAIREQKSASAAGYV